MGMRTGYLAIGVLAAGVMGGCVIISPALPCRVPGYGREYTILDESGRPAREGSLVLLSRYVGAPDKVSAFPIHEGRCRVPDETDVRQTFSSGMGWPIWFWRMENPRGTYVFPLVAGHVPWRPLSFAVPHCSVSAPDGADAAARGELRVRSAPWRQEAQMLWDLAGIMRVTPPKQKETDSDARRRVLEHIRQRCAVLGVPEVWPARELPGGAADAPPAGPPGAGAAGPDGKTH